MKRFVYAPKIEAHIQIQDTGEVIDLSDDIIDATVTRRVNAVSNASLTLQNKFGKYTRQFKPQDRIVIWLTRTKRTLVFSGLLDVTPLWQIYPAPITIEASCTLKLLQNTYFDPGLVYTQQFFARYGMVFDPTSGQLTDPLGRLGNSDVNGGIAKAMIDVLKEIGGWPKEYIHVLGLPHAFIAAMGNLMTQIEMDERQQFQQITSWMSTILGVDDLTSDPSLTIPQEYVGGGGHMNVNQVAKLAKSVGFSGENLVTAVAVSAAESSFNPVARNVNNNGSVDLGLWQINSVHIGATINGVNLNGEQMLYDTAINAKVAYGLWQSQGFSPWTTFTHGEYLKHIRQARDAVVQIDSAVAQVATPVIQQDAARHREPLSSSALPEAPLGPGVSWSGVAAVLHEAANEICSQFPGLIVTATKNGNHANGSYHYQGLAIDLAAPYTSDGIELMNQAAAYIKDRFSGQLLEGIHNNNLSIKDGGAVQPSFWGSTTWGQHLNHIHVAMPATADVTSGVIGGSAGGTSSIAGTSSLIDGALTVQQVAGIARQSAFFTLQLQGTDAALSNLLTGDHALANDISLFDWFQALATAAGREFCSMPDGSFLAFFPDYFGYYGRAPYWQISELEVIDMTIQLTDRDLATHVFAAGSTFGGTQINIEDRMFSTVASVLAEEFDIFVNANKKTFNAKQFLQRYGARPFVYDVPEIRHPILLFIAAWMKFTEKWSEQFVANAELTFLPELFPGGRVAIGDTGIEMYVEEVTHSIDRSSGYTTSATLKAPATTDGSQGALVAAGDLGWRARAKELLGELTDSASSIGPEKDSNTQPQRQGRVGGAQ